jgi:NADH-quinone oxidoreductase subunit J
MFKILFYTISALLLTMGILTVTSRKFFRSAVYLLGTLLATAGIYFMMALNFIAIVQIIIYVGGIVVLILFSILLTNTAESKSSHPPVGKMIGAGIVSLAGFALTAHLLYHNLFSAPASGVENMQIKSIGTQLLNVNETGYVLPFEVITILLVVAMISSILIAVDENKTGESEFKENLRKNIEKVIRTGISKEKIKEPVAEELEEPLVK